MEIRAVTDVAQSDCGVRGHRFAPANRKLCVRCGHIDAFDGTQGLSLACWRCGETHIGSMMRTNDNPRTVNFIDIECPKQGRRFALCHLCQRSLWFSGAVEVLMLNDTRLHLPGKFWNWVPKDAFKD